MYTCGYEDLEIPGDDEDVLLIKWSYDGEIVWKKSWGKYRYSDYTYDILGDSSNIYTVGYRINDRTKDREIVILKWDFDGDIIAEKLLQPEAYDNYVVQDAWILDEYLYIIGYCYFDYIGIENWDPDIFILKLPKNFTSDKIPGFSVYLLSGTIVLGIGVLISAYRIKQKNELCNF